MKPKLLLISAIPPFPQTSGGATRIYHTILELSKKYSIYFVTFNSSTDEFYSKYTTQFINLPLLSKTLFSHLPYHFSPWNNQTLFSIISSLLSENKFAAIQVDFTQLLFLINFLPKNIPTTFVAEDISTVSFFRRIPESTGILKKISASLFCFQIWTFEKKYLPKYNQIVTVSNTDQKLLQKIFHLQSTVIPNGIAKINFLPKTKSSTLRLGFIGSFSHSPNKQAISFFINKIAPLLSNFNYQFYLAGNNPDFSEPNIVNLDIVKNLADFYQNIDILVAPIFSGSGSRIKILESLSFATPVVTTPIGAEGIDLNSNYLQIANTPAEFIQKIKYLSQIKDLNPDNLHQQLKPLLWSNVFSPTPKRF